jgi:hypothetical protein
MALRVTVAFWDNREHEIRLADAEVDELSAERAREWLDDQWVALECEADGPLGKTLTVDKILCVARYGGEKRFAAAGEWARQFARVTAKLLDRPAIRVDVAEQRVG